MRKLALALAAAPILLSTATLAQEEPILDYRDPAFLSGTPFASEAERREIAAALAEAPDDLAAAYGEDFAILGEADGAFTAPERQERIVLVQAEAAVAIDPFPDAPAPLLLVMSDDAPTAVFALPGDVQYQRLVAASDADGDGREEVLLETSFMNMGQSVISVDVVGVGDGEAKVLQSLAEMYVDACANPAGQQSRTASVLLWTPEGLRAEPHEEECP